MGGRWNGWRHLVSSNVDWGQDLIALERFIAEHPEAAGLALAYQGGFDPKHVGIASRSMRPDDASRLLAAETWNSGPATEWEYFAFGGTAAAGYGRSVVPPKLTSRLATEKPFARIGDATVVHRIPKPDADKAVPDR